LSTHYHDIEAHKLNIWRGGLRPDENVWTGAVMGTEDWLLCNGKITYRRFEMPADTCFHDCRLRREKTL